MSPTPQTRRGFLRILASSAVAAGALGRAQEIDAALTHARSDLRFRASDPASVQALRDQYLLAPDLLYLNHASIGTTPRAVVEAHAGYLSICETHPSLYVWGPVWREALEDARSAAAALVRCQPDDLAVTHNTTEGFSVLAQGLPLGTGDEVLFSSLNHAGAAVAWHGLAERGGFRVRVFPFPVEDTPGLSAEDVVRIHAEAIRPETRVLVFPHVDNMVGLRHPVSDIAAAAREAGVEFVLVDGAQSVGMIPLDLGGAGVDAYAMSCHKWLQSPKGLGLLYVAAGLRETLPRMWFKTPGERMDGSARLYEDYSTRAWPGVVALTDALGFQQSLGEGEKERRYRAMFGGVLDRVDAEEGLDWRSPRDWALGSMVMSVRVRGRSAPELGPELLASQGAVVRAFGGDLNAVRVSPNLMTDDGELEGFLRGLAAGSS